MAGTSVTEPFRDDSFDGLDEREPEGQYVDDDLAPQPGSYFLSRCLDCKRLVTHATFADEHGANKIDGCVTCRRILDTPTQALPIPDAWQEWVKDKK